MKVRSKKRSKEGTAKLLTIKNQAAYNMLLTVSEYLGMVVDV